MNKIKTALAAVADKLVSNESNLHKAQRRHKKFRLKAEGISDKKGRPYRRAHAKAIYWKGRVKQQQARIHHLERSDAQIEKELAVWKREHKIQVHGNKVTGGTRRQRIKVAIHTAALNYQRGHQPGYYSQEGLAPVYDHSLIGYPDGHRYDCSSWADGAYYCADLKDPSGTDWDGGFTGTEGEHGREVSEAEALTGDLVLYGPFPHHHVEIVDDPQAKTTIGHGSPPIDAGVFDLFGDGDFVIRSYLN